ncbi:hypothetical protein [uncultured Kordia sp.]|uniref:hypothetical protein n=1 Tax=uncultured Kordia sp. TaxID=507699 RepID=UPI00261EDD3D|nr:hypothetical protein [uncultured Kordia sp.]
MNFFKKLFSSKKSTQKQDSPQQTKESLANEGEIKEIYTTNYFAKRYSEDTIDEFILDGCLKVIKGFYIDNNIDQKVENPLNHPINLDQVVQDGMGFHMYCKAFNLADKETMMYLALAFADYMIKAFDFKLYQDNEPEFPLRAMTIKYDKNQTVMSLYPIEYALKVLNDEATFEDIHTKVKTHLESMPDMNDLLDQFMNRDTDE